MTHPTPQRGTDKVFYQLMQLSGSAMLRLLGIPAQQAENYQFKALTLKDKRLEPDIAGYPVLENPDCGRVFIEFQGYVDKMIRQRLVAEMYFSCLADQYTGALTAAIFYTDAEYQAKASALNIINQHSSIHLHEIVLTDYTEQQLVAIDPRLCVLSPFTLSQPQPKLALQDKVQLWKATLQDHYSEQDYPDAIKMLGVFLLNRCRNFSHEEIYRMLNLNLLDTQAGQDIFAMGESAGLNKGRQEGKQEGLTKGREEERQHMCEMLRNSIISDLQMRFNQVPDTLVQQLQQIEAPASLIKLSKEALQCNDLAEFITILTDHVSK